MKVDHTGQNREVDLSASIAYAVSQNNQEMIDLLNE
jgi:hypothetical protein